MEAWKGYVQREKPFNLLSAVYPRAGLPLLHSPFTHALNTHSIHDLGLNQIHCLLSGNSPLERGMCRNQQPKTVQHLWASQSFPKKAACEPHITHRGELEAAA